MKKLFLLLCLGLGLIPLVSAQNLKEGCVSDYDPTIDYFADKAEIQYAANFDIQYFNNYKVLSVSNPWDEEPTQYVLVQCGTPAPENLPDALMLEVPITSMMALSTTHVAHLAQLGLLEHLIGVDTGLFFNNPDVIAKLEAGELLEVGSGSSINVEVVLAAEPNVIMAYSSGLSEYDAHPILLDAGLDVVLNNEWVETSPLGRAEWLKFTAALFNAEAEANAIFEQIVTDYTQLASLTVDLSDKPTVLPNTFNTYDEAWAIPGGDSFAAQLIQDAGGDMILGDAPEVQGQVGSILFDFEVVYEKGLEADLWLLGAFGVATLDDLIAQDERYADFTGAVWNNDAIVNANGGNDYWESGVTRPDLILADLIAIFHPDLLPDHVMVYHRPLE